MQKSEKTLEKTIQNISLIIKKFFEKLHNYLWFSWWLIVFLLFVIIFLVFHYQNKIEKIGSSRVVYYENPFNIRYRTSIFDDFDKYFDRQQRYFDNLFQKQEKLMRNYSDLFDSNKLQNKPQKQSYQKYYLNDWKIYSYNVNYDNWFVNWSFVVDDLNKREFLINNLETFWLEVSDKNTKVVFSWNIDDINALLQIFD